MNTANAPRDLEAEFRASPALQRLAPEYPERFAKRVPRRVRVLRTVRPCFPFSGQPAVAGQEYLAWTNSYGAVSAILPDANLGLMPDEFEVVEWAGETTAAQPTP